MSGKQRGSMWRCVVVSGLALVCAGTARGDESSPAPGEDIAALEQALARQEALGDRPGVADTLVALGRARAKSGDLAGALEVIGRGVALAEQLDIQLPALDGLSAQARILLRMGRLHESVASARHALAIGEEGLEALRPDLAALTRVLLDPAREAGILAAIRLDDVATAAWFVDHGRASAVLGAIASRDAVARVVLPRESVEEEARARAAETAALAAYRQALESKDVAAIRARRAHLLRAREEASEAGQALAEGARSLAATIAPHSMPLSDVSLALASHEALVLYEMLSVDSLAIVVRPGSARIVPLGPTQAIRDAIAALASAADATADPVPAARALRRLVLDPLELDAGIRTILVSPDGEFSRVPFAMLVGARAVAFVPSGTFLAVARAASSPVGEGVLAVADPDYGATAPVSPPALTREGGRLAPLPGTRAEAEAITGPKDTRLLGGDATVEGLVAALASRPRWRAVHFAVHTILDVERPALSSLALADSPARDGFLHAHEIRRMRVPADLVVVSGCEGAAGGDLPPFVDAFLAAGASRLLGNLWKVDDAAATAFMRRFYEKIREGAPSVDALREARAFVRSRPEWRHPYYWAGWTIWGDGR